MEIAKRLSKASDNLQKATDMAWKGTFMAYNTRRTIIIYWLLLILPTVFLGAAGLRLLYHEKERLKVQSLSVLADRAQAMTESLEFTVSDVEDALTRSLVGIDPKQLKGTLLSWEKSNPLIRNVFVWQEGKLDYPMANLESTAEERRFISRYDALFSGRLAWGFGEEVSRDEWTSSGVPSLSKSSSYRPEVMRMKSARKDLLDLARPEQEATYSPQSETNQAAPFRVRSGWIPWFSENQLFILGWVQATEKGPVYGIELEFMALLSRLITQLPVLTDTGAAYGLLAGDGKLLHQSGAFPIDAGQKPVISVPLSGLLPHYRIVFYQSEGAFHGGMGLIYVTGILVFMFTGAMILGGALLIRDSRRSMNDAMEKTSFVSSVSHELKTPLTSIRMYAELLRDGRVKAPEKISHYLSVIVSESQRLTRLVNNVLDFGKLEEGKKNYHKSSFDLGSFLREITDAHSLRLKEAGISVHLVLPEKYLPLETDRDALEQVVLNLMDNAVKYAASGGFLAFEVQDEKDSPYLELLIRDRGPGIPEDHRTRIFKKFHRVDNSLTAGQAGSGLGLSIARRILRDLGGDLSYHSEQSRGSCFRARIKRA